MLANKRHDTQQSNTQHSDINVTLGINDAQHEQNLVTSVIMLNVAILIAIMLCVVALSVLFELLLCWVS
jgi:hypothetical protein